MPRLLSERGHQHQPVYKTGASLIGHIGNKQDREEPNPVKRLWRPPALPGARSCKSDPSCPSPNRGSNQRTPRPPRATVATFTGCQLRLSTRAGRFSIFGVKKSSISQRGV
jgi:hypothetical protein